MFNRVKKLEKRIKALEEFLGATLDDSDPDYLDYTLGVHRYDLKKPKFKGILGDILNEKDKK
jgi:hypothetical protein